MTQTFRDLKDIDSHGIRTITAKAWFCDPKIPWLYSSGVDDELDKVLAPISFLLEFGSSYELQLERQQLGSNWETWKETACKSSERKRIGGALKTLDKHLGKLCKRAGDAEGILGQHGWRFDQASRKIKQITFGHRSLELINHLVGLVHQKFDLHGNYKKTRTQIKGFLLGYFPEEYLDDRRRGNIGNAIDNWIKKNRRKSPPKPGPLRHKRSS